MLLCSDSYAIDPATVDLNSIAQEVITHGDAALQNYSPDNALLTGQVFSRLYFGVFETKGMEFALGIYDQNALLNLEMQFSTVMSLAMKGVDKELLNSEWQNLRQNLRDSAKEHQDKHSSGFWSLFWQSLLILLREGFEAMLVVTALITYLRRSGAGDKVLVIWTGVALALLASAATAWALSQFTQGMSGARREAVEGIVMLLAAGVMVYVSYWLFAKREAERWQSFIKGTVDQAVNSGSLFMLGFAAFLAVFREGAETILFYQALLAGGDVGSTPVLSGFLAASVLLVGVFYALRKASIRLPLKVFFTATACFLFLMAFIFVGKGILELQVAGWLATSLLSGGPQIPMLGIFATKESLGAQLALILAAVLPFLILQIKRNKTVNSSA